MNKPLITVVILGLIVLAFIFFFVDSGGRNPYVNNEQQNQNNENEENANNEADLSNMDPDTKIYTSDKLGIRFRYDSKPRDTFEVTVTEQDSKIYLHGTSEQPQQGKVIEVFTKDPSVSLEEAIKRQFLANYSEKDCYVTSDSTSEPGVVVAVIDYPPPSDPNAPFWENSNKCPEDYAKTNAVQYFMMDNDIKNKYIFLRLGQDSITSDGTPVTELGGRDWSASVEIFK